MKTRLPPTFRQCVDACWRNAAFMCEYRRLRGHVLGRDVRSGLERMIDGATGYVPPVLDDAEAHAFFEFVRDYVWRPVLTHWTADDAFSMSIKSSDG